MVRGIDGGRWQGVNMLTWAALWWGVVVNHWSGITQYRGGMHTVQPVRIQCTAVETIE